MAIKNIISDMDGVIYRGKNLIPGAKECVENLLKNNIKFLFLTNNSEQTAIDLIRKLELLGIKGLTEKNFITSAMATAMFLSEQKPGGTAYVIGGGGLINELYKVGFSISENNPDYVVVGKTKSYNFEMIKKAVELINKGAKFIATNPDVIDPIENGIEPACGALLAPIERATGKSPFVVGKPNAIMMTLAKRKLGVHSEETLMIGDRMDTDIIGGLEAGMKTCLVLSGVSTKEMLNKFPYRPNYIFNNISEVNLEKINKELEILEK
ncbi:HAD-IIA family hydrolase [Haliovirga abyssi]|uniref:Acid sugar phosphatase n=1 Tax=Haliovirga abyssi TaxID=2996794 RepID=A0AAU9DX04_9FUSO|nr:HAD-IIA family hydrolase [Haliovirga abyssi]BDU50896.1 acid sugar phosphatase [Haliovirga abyssi]